MNIERLVAMANDIAAFFAGADQPQDRAGDVAAHLRRYWDPRMRAQLVAWQRAGGQGLSSVAQQAVEQLSGDGK